MARAGLPPDIVSEEKMGNHRKALFCALLLVVLLFAASCARMDKAVGTKNAGKEVYIKENGEYVPYIVLTDDYYGNMLLLRKCVDYSHIYNKAGLDHGSYYADSEMDRFLETEVYQRYEDSLKNIIVSSDIKIASKKAIDTHNNEMDTITRKVFLLSVYELGFETSHVAAKEGLDLRYFLSTDSRIAYDSAGNAKQYDTRSVAYADGSSIFGVADDGVVGIGGINGPSGPYEGGVRPAFCIPADTKMELKAGIVDGKEVYVICR